MNPNSYEDNKFLKCIVDGNRRRTPKFLGKGERCVNEIAEHLGIEQSLTPGKNKTRWEENNVQSFP